MKYVAFIFLSVFTLNISMGQTQAPLGKLLQRTFSVMHNNDQALVLITFTDKGKFNRLSSTQAASILSERAIKRRMKVRAADKLLDEGDVPLEQSYVRALEGKVIVVRHQLKWFNAVSAIATKQQIEQLRTLPFVSSIDLVGRWRKNESLEREEILKGIPSPSIQSTTVLFDSAAYGLSYKQNLQLNVPAVHNMGIYGQGVFVGVFDNGFRLPGHEAFSSMHIIATYDFVDHKVSVVPINPSTSFGSHGVNTLSTIGGYKAGQLIGPAFRAEYILARTENDSSETPIEEDNWAAAIQWADSIGVDVTSTSLGYLTYDAPYPSWTWQDMNGNTTLITRASDRAAGLGIVVVNSAGNGGPNGSHNTLGAPADGDSVISVGSVDANGVVASTSSVGPTTNVPARIKPDVMARGVSVRVASSTNPTGYTNASGTSFSCPLTAGVAALVLCANPSLTPMQVRQALRQTANNAGSPNNTYGWGIVNTLSAINYYGAAGFAHISGRKFHDLNHNGVRESGEPGIAGVKIRLTGVITDSAVTDLLGTYLFDSLAIGSYTVSEDVPLGWAQTFPLSGTQSVTIDSLKQNTTGKNFGNARLGVVHGKSFEDVNGNGVFDIGEPALAGWKISLAGPSPDSTVTDSFGDYTFSNISPGSYTLSESLHTGWTQGVPPGSYSLTITLELDSSGLNFANYQPGAIHGMKFDDVNHNRTKDSIEVGLEGWHIHLTGASSASAVTDSAGHYSFTDVPPGAYTIAESSQTGWYQMYPSNNGVHSVTMRSGLDTAGFDFGNIFAGDAIYSVQAGWNLLSLPREIANHSASVLYPTAVSKPFAYTGFYTEKESLANGTGYWLKFPSAQDVLIEGEVRFADTVAVYKGWNVVGSPTLKVVAADIVQIPDSIVVTSYFLYDGTSYNAADTLRPHNGYWVKVKSDGTLILPSTTSQASSSHSEKKNPYVRKRSAQEGSAPIK